MIEFSLSRCPVRRTGVLTAVFAVFLCLTFTVPAASGESLLGFDFMTPSKRAFAIANHMGLRTLEKGKTKNARREAVFSGSAAQIPIGTEETITRISFYRDKIEAVTLLGNGADEEDAQAVAMALRERYGAPDAEEEVFSYRVKSWNLSNSRLTFSYSGDTLKISQSHLETRKERHERDLTRERLKDKRHPVQKMLDGDFSKPEYK
ncbi:MAG: hypothetical protein GKS04_05855 [Candidatus Mycalebacterium zealandia]|nr:MAG: hypothetical protein GKS04_05855 [Candidatus Mycalebacterium zealandia]